MKLGKLERLMARLSLKMQSSQLHQLRFSCSELSESQKMEAQSPIKLLVILKRKSTSNEHFVSVLEQQFEGSEDFEDLSKIMQEFRSKNPDPNEIEPLSGPTLPNGAFVFHPGKDQSHVFKRMLLNVSNSINWIHLEIMVAISPIPDSLKEHMNKGYQLFEELKRHGCISENDTELLDEVFTLFNVQTPLRLLRTYQEQYPQTIFPEPPPSAPAFATPLLSLQPHSSYSSPSESTSAFHSLPSVHTPTEAGGSSYMSRLLPGQPHSLPHRVPTYPRPPQTTSPQHTISSTYPRPPTTSAAFSSFHSSQQTQPSSSITQPSLPPRPSSTPPFTSQIPYPTTRSLEERRKRHQGEREGDQLTDPPEEQPPAVKRTREMTNLTLASARSYPPTSQTPDSLPEGGPSSLSSVGSSLATYSSEHVFQSGVAEVRNPLQPVQPEQEERSPKRTLAEQQETVRMYQVSEGHARISPSLPPYSKNTNTPLAPTFTPQNHSRALEHHHIAYSHPHSSCEEHRPHSNDEEPHPKPHAYTQASNLTDNEQLVYGEHRAKGQSAEESGERGSEKLLGPYGRTLRHQREYAPVHVLVRPLVHGMIPPMSINVPAQQHTSTRPPDDYSQPPISQQVHRTEEQSAEESGERGSEKLLGPYGRTLRHRREYAPVHVLEHPLVHGMIPPMSINVPAQQHTSTRPPGGYTQPPTSQQVHRTEEQSAEESGERGSEKLLGLYGTLTSQAQQHPPTRPPDGYSEPLTSQYPHSRREPETYSQPASCSESGNSELATGHESSSGLPVRQASSQANVAICVEGRYDELGPPSYISQHSFPETRGPFVGNQPHSYELPSGSTFGSSPATNDLLSSESSEFSNQHSTMQSQPSTAHLLSSIEETQSEEEEEEEEEQEPQLNKLKPAKQQKSSTLPAEEKQPKSWPSRVLSKMWSTFIGSAQKEKENEDSDDTYESCDDDVST